MRLKILLATEVLTDETVEKVTADGLHGSFTLLPRHTDVLAALVPGLVSYLLPGGEERFAAVDGGLMVKRGALVTVSTPRGFSATIRIDYTFWSRKSFGRSTSGPVRRAAPSLASKRTSSAV